MAKRKQISLETLILDFFKQNPNRDLAHEDCIDEITEKYKQLYNRIPRDPWRSARLLHAKGFLIKISNGVYHYDPEAVENRSLEEFTEEQKRFILERDEYRCVVCGRGEKDGITLHVDHIRPKHLGGDASVENGQTLCAQHNYLKKTTGQTETGKRIFIRLYKLARKDKNEEMIRFCEAIFKVFDDFGINGHIDWKKAK